MMPNRRGFILRPLLDDDGEPTTRAELIATERGDQNEYEADRTWRPPRDPGLVARLVELQRRAS
jgi:hypothetical protein